MPCQPFEPFCSLGRWPHVGPVAGISDVSAANGRIVADVSPARGGHQAAGGGLEPSLIWESTDPSAIAPNLPKN